MITNQNRFEILVLNTGGGGVGLYCTILAFARPPLARNIHFTAFTRNGESLGAAVLPDQPQLLIVGSQGGELEPLMGLIREFRKSTNPQLVAVLADAFCEGVSDPVFDAVVNMNDDSGMCDLAEAVNQYRSGKLRRATCSETEHI